jgi:hypothetical protein
MQKIITGFLHVEGRHTSQNLSQTFCRVMVKWYVEKKFVLSLDNASANKNVVKDIIANLKDSNETMGCDIIRCACLIIWLIGMV